MPTVQVRLKAGEAEAERIFQLLEMAFEDDGYPVTREETPAYSNIWTIDVILFELEPAAAEALVYEVIGESTPGVEISSEVLDDSTNWVAKSLEVLRPVVAGRFFVHGSHDRAKVPMSAIGLEIDAALAFGTGHHATTWACLKALDRILARRRFFHPLDLGTGTGVLAIAIAELQGGKVLATDIDPVAVRIAAENAHLNGVGSHVETLVADGMGHRRFAERGPFDLVVANILARPLMLLAAPIARHLARDAVIVLSGLRVEDAPRVLSAYRMQGVTLRWSVTRDNWMALVLSNART